MTTYNRKTEKTATHACSAIVTTTQTILTAEHCLHAQYDKKNLFPLKIVFQFERRNGKPSFSTTANVFLDPGLRGKAEGVLSDYLDFAFLKLAEPIPSRLNPHPVDSLTDEDFYAMQADFGRQMENGIAQEDLEVNLMSCGYTSNAKATNGSTDTPVYTTCVASAEYMFASDYRSFRNTDCMSGPGLSGGPLFLEAQGKQFIWGITHKRFGSHSAKYLHFDRFADQLDYIREVDIDKHAIKTYTKESEGL